MDAPHVHSVAVLDSVEADVARAPLAPVEEAGLRLLVEPVVAALGEELPLARALGEAEEELGERVGPALVELARHDLLGALVVQGAELVAVQQEQELQPDSVVGAPELQLVAAALLLLEPADELQWEPWVAELHPLLELPLEAVSLEPLQLEHEALVDLVVQLAGEHA
ncbi:hypothetical protein [Mumia zhuanghuii]|uniref:Uncharacterized protein n=1 Tax=Mumia zhuanghuii TaxID=2585211 RepID=A0A5C4MDZ2_9ACTN|nr:hypothetical protein [Mumia zhuanghuii]TNC31286.1 hypothetical protein FHE65_31935 [Mumia zhuanghuii]